MKKQLLTILTIAVMTFTANAQDYCPNLDGANNERVRYLTSTGDVLDNMLNGAADYTIEIWIYPTTALNKLDGTIKRFDQFALNLWENASDPSVHRRIYFKHWADGGSSTIVNSIDDAIILNQWNHLVVICDSGANTLKLYANGVDVTLTPQTALTLRSDQTNSNLYVGHRGSGGSGFNGYIDKVRVKNTTELIGNLQSDITDPGYTPDANTAILYNFDEGTGSTTLNDTTVTSSDGTIQCSYATCTDPVTQWTLVSATLATENNNLIDFGMYPNPTRGSFTINANESIKNVQIFDVLGKSVKNVEVSERATQLNIDVNDLSKGIYFVKTATDAGIGTQKIIIQ